jgi:hypothetical protein
VTRVGSNAAPPPTPSTGEGDDFITGGPGSDDFALLDREREVLDREVADMGADRSSSGRTWSCCRTASRASCRGCVDRAQKRPV